MRVLIIVAQDPHHSFLVWLHSEKLRHKIRNLIARGKNSLAMVTALSQGRFEKEVACNEIHGVKADLLISENSVSWDLSRK